MACASSRENPARKRHEDAPCSSRRELSDQQVQSFNLHWRMESVPQPSACKIRKPSRSFGPRDSTSSKVCPSTPGAPRLDLPVRRHEQAIFTLLALRVYGPKVTGCVTESLSIPMAQINGSFILPRLLSLPSANAGSRCLWLFSWRDLRERVLSTSYFWSADRRYSVQPCSSNKGSNSRFAWTTTSLLFAG